MAIERNRPSWESESRERTFAGAQPPDRRATADARRPSPTLSIGLLILRLGMGGYLLTHGWGKLQMLLAGDFEKMGDPLGFLGPQVSLVLVTFAEFVCAILVMLGLATRLAALTIVISFAVAAFVAHGNDPWTMTGQGPSKEPALLYLIPFFALVWTGPGRIAIDAWIRSRWLERRARR